MAKFNQGDQVEIVTRQQTGADSKSQLYYPHFAGLRGVILKIYGEEASVLVDRETLPDEIRARHEENEASERRRYLDRLSEEARNRLSQKEKDFSLQYAVLVSLADLRPDSGAAPRRLTASDLDAAEEQQLKQRERK